MQCKISMMIMMTIMMMMVSVVIMNLLLNWSTLLVVYSRHHPDEFKHFLFIYVATAIGINFFEAVLKILVAEMLTVTHFTDGAHNELSCFFLIQKPTIVNIVFRPD